MTSPKPGAATARLQALAAAPSGDRTLDQVRTQLRAFGCDTYEIQPIPPKGVDGLARERIRKWTGDQIERAVGWLKRMNALGYDIFIRPAAPTDDLAHALAFVDDLDQDQVDRMRADGLPFAVLNESSPANFHGWVRVADEPLPKAEMTQAARMIAHEYGGDPAAADWRHHGRLAGFTNRKPSRAGPRGAPFVMLRAWSGETAPRGPELVARVRQAMEIEQRTAARAAAGRASIRMDVTPGGDPVAAFLEARAAAHTTRPKDESARDYSAALSMLRRGFAPDLVAAAIRAASPHLAERHRDAEGYISRTIANAEAKVASTPRLR
ncbi:MAG: DNA-primase RepB domain-containing protein [Acetobacteraceae bacterium]|nr:DNA-primase RepB domain-containing protein [Acetobacteraceae bacterium]